ARARVSCATGEAIMAGPDANGTTLGGIASAFDKLFSRIPQVAHDFVFNNYDKLAHSVYPVALSLMIAWWAWRVLKMYSGRVPMDGSTIVGMMIVTFWVFWCLSWGGMGSQVYSFFTELRDDTITALLGSKDVHTYIANQITSYDTAAAQLMDQSWTSINMIVLGAFLMILNTLIVAVVLLLKITSDLGLAMTMVLFPLFVPCLAWEQTRGYGMSWVGAMVKFALVGILLMVSLKINYEFVGELITQSGNFIEKVSDAALAIALEIFSLIFVAFGLRPLASALASSGAAGSGVAGAIGGMALGAAGRALGTALGVGGGASPATQAATAMQQMGRSMESMSRNIEALNKHLGVEGGSSHGALGREPSSAGQPGASMSTAVTQEASS
ncbi:type IV secretion system protein, partial [Burkholderia sp. AU28863]